MALIETWRQFAEATIKTHDLDPTYDFLFAAKQDMGTDWTNRFALHYLMFYDLGGAIHCAQNTHEADFWSYVMDNYDDFPRGTERRHSRGIIGRKYAENLLTKGTPRDIIRAMHSPSYKGLVSVFDSHFKGCGFGPYFIWKVMDFQDRIFERPVHLSLTNAVKYCPDEPRRCAKTLWPDHDFKYVIDQIAFYIRHLPAPGAPDRNCGLPEAETILCMLKGYGITQTHTIGDDVDSKWDQLRKWPEFHKFLPPQLDWSNYERPHNLDTEALSANLAGMAD